MAGASWVNGHAGTVVDQNRWTDTRVWSSGGGGYIDPRYGGHVSPPTIHSSNIPRVEIFSRDSDGQEARFDFSEKGVSFRPGSRLFALWGAEQGGTTGPYLYIENLDTRETFAAKQPLKVGGWGILNGLAAGAILGCMLWVWNPFNYLPSPQNEQLQQLEKKVETEAMTWAQKCTPGSRYKNKTSSPAHCYPGFSNWALPGQEAWCFCGTVEETARLLSADSSKRRDLDFLREDAQKAQRAHSQEVERIRTVAATVLGILIWVVFGVRKSGRLKKLALKKRHAFFELAIEEAGKHGIILTYDKSTSESLERATGSTQ